MKGYTMAKKYCVDLSMDERCALEHLLEVDRAAKHKKHKARVLLKIDQGDLGPAWIDSRAAEAFDCTVRSIEKLRKRLVEEGFEKILEHGNENNSYARKITGREEAQIIATACGQAPEGRERWTVRLLRDKVVELNIVEDCSKSTIGNVLKKTSLSLT
jgi:hypothetical protein